LRPAIASIVAFIALAFAAADASAASPVTLAGWAGVQPGMTVSQVEGRLGVDLTPDVLPGSTCGTAGFTSSGTVGYALFIDGRLGSLWFRRGAETDRGVRIGSTAAAIFQTYPTARSRVDHYDPAARNVFVRRKKAPHWRLRFDVSAKGRVISIAFGDSTVFLVEGCA
jgi:hypothetical protein